MSAPTTAVPGQRFPSRWLGEGRWQAALLLLTGIVGFISWSPRLGDFRGYLQVGRAVLAGADIYRDTPPGVNTWPPFFSLVCVPLALIARVSTYLATSLWILLNFAVLLLILDLVALTLYGRRLTLRRQAAPGLSITSAELFVPLVLTAFYLFNNFELVQISLIMLGLTLGGLYLLQTGRTAAGALALGLAIAIKIMPVVFLPYLAYRRAWRACLATAIAAGALALSPIGVFGWTRFWEYVATWRRVIGFGWGVGSYNQSIYAMWDRIIGHHLYPFAPGENYFLIQSGHPGVMVAWWATIGLIGLVALWRFRFGAAASPRVIVAEWSVVLIVSALAGPVTWKLYLVVLLLPNALLFAVWRLPAIGRRDRRAVGWVLFSSAFLALLNAHDLFGHYLSGQLEVGSITTLSGLVMLAGVLWLRGRPDLLSGSGAPVEFAAG